MTGGVFRGTAVEDIKAGADVEVAISGGQVLVSLSHRPGTPAFACWRQATHGRACEAKPLWRVERQGDAVVSWACSPHLAALVADLQRPGEVTHLTVRRSMLAEVASDGG